MRICLRHSLTDGVPNGNKVISFYYCQIAPYDYGIITERGKEVINTAYLREAQAQVEHRVPNTGMAVLLDAGMEKAFILPVSKLPVSDWHFLP